MNFDLLGEQELKVKLLGSDKKAFLYFYQQTRRGLQFWVQQRVKSVEDAEEIVQDTYLGFLDSLPLFRGESSLFTFLISIARHEVADYWRKQYAKKVIKTVPFVDHIYSERLYSSVVLRSVVEQVFSRLRREQAWILRLKYEEGKSVQEIAKYLGVSVKAAESRLFRARKAFQAVYETMSSR